ncbi:MAG TPA: SRPBCC family protein [Gemmatimonadales bacterium]|nr:SRPBCC family protein [Gemmatimonadales bacterium]
MTWIAVGIGVLIGLGLVTALIGSLLPRDHTAQVALDVAAPPDRVWALVSNFAASAQWRPDVREVLMEPPAPAPAGGRVRFTEVTRQGKTPFEVMSQSPPVRQVVRVVDDGLPFGGTWTWEIAPAGRATRLTITEQGFIRNPVFRVMGRLFFKPTATLERYLRAVSAALQESAEPVVVKS